MSWEETLLDASFKGLGFDCVLTRDSDERDVAEYLYPFRSGGELDDLGRGIRRFDLVAVFFGGDYEERLQRFLEKLEEPGPGELIHPVFGSIPQAQLRAKLVDHDAESPDYCTVRMTFLEQGDANPFFARELPAGKADAISAFAAAVNDLGAQEFLDTINGLKLQSNLLTRLNAVRDVMGSVLSSVRSVVDSYVSTGLDLLSFPGVFLSDLGAGVAGLVDLRLFETDTLMPDWSGLVDDIGSVMELPAGLASGNPPQRFAGGSKPANAPSLPGNPGGPGSVATAAIPIASADLATITAAAQLAAASALTVRAAEILADQADIPTLSPAEVERIANDTRATLQVVIETYRDNVELEAAHPICEGLRDMAAAVQASAAAVINLLPPLEARQVTAQANLRLLAFRWYGNHARAAELARLNPNLRYPNNIRAGDELYGFLR